MCVNSLVETNGGAISVVYNVSEALRVDLGTGSVPVSLSVIDPLHLISPKPYSECFV